MYDTQSRVERLELAVKLRKNRRQDLQITALRMVSCALGAVELGLLISFTNGQLQYTSDAYLFGASMLSENVGSYVLVGVLAFVAAVVFTILCMNHRKK